MKKRHPNKKYHNWIVYKKNESFLIKKKDLFRGVLYDLGCGESSYKEFFIDKIDKYIGVDWAGSFHSIKPDIFADLNKDLPIESDVADTVFCFSVLEHLSEPQKILDESYRILKNKGNLILQVPWQHEIHEEPYDFFRYTPYGLKYMLEKAGFVNIEIIPSSGFFTMLFLKINYFLTRVIRKKIVKKAPFLKIIFGLFLVPFWFLLQMLAPIFDKFDKNWEAEAMGYYVTANK